MFWQRYDPEAKLTKPFDYPMMDKWTGVTAPGSAQVAAGSEKYPSLMYPRSAVQTYKGWFGAMLNTTDSETYPNAFLTTTTIEATYSCTPIWASTDNAMHIELDMAVPFAFHAQRTKGNPRVCKKAIHF